MGLLFVDVEEWPLIECEEIHEGGLWSFSNLQRVPTLTLIIMHDNIIQGGRYCGQKDIIHILTFSSQ